MANEKISKGNLKKQVEAALTGHADFISLLKWKGEAAILQKRKGLWRIMKQLFLKGPAKFLFPPFDCILKQMLNRLFSRGV